MSDPRPSGVTFLYRARPAAWVFTAEPRDFRGPILIPESEASTLDLCKQLDDYQANRLASREFGVMHVYKLNLRDEGEEPLYNARPRYGKERGIEICTQKHYFNLPQVGDFAWGDVGRPVGSSLRVYHVAESMMVGAIEESWFEPGAAQWVVHASYAILPDKLMETAEAA